MVQARQQQPMLAQQAGGGGQVAVEAVVAVSRGGGGGGAGGGNLVIGGALEPVRPIPAVRRVLAAVFSSVDGVSLLRRVTLNDVESHAIDAHDGTVLWHYYWKYRGGTTTGTRGPSMWHNYIYFRKRMTTRLFVWMLKTGHEVWKKGNLAGSTSKAVFFFECSAGDRQSHHCQELRQRFRTCVRVFSRRSIRRLAMSNGSCTPPRRIEGDPGENTWPSLDAARHGGGSSWIPGAYDPDTHLYMFGTGNPTPAYTQGRGDGDNLYTSCLLAINIDTGKIVWYFSTSPHDTHDWDSTQTPAIADLPFNGRVRKLIMMATRNGYFYVLDRTTGEHLLTSKLGLVNNYASAVSPDSPLHLNARGEVQRNPNKDATIAGSLVNSDVLNFPPPTFSPDTGLFYVHEQNSLRIDYLLEPDPRGSMGLGGTGGGGGASYGTFLDAIDYKTGKVMWRHELTNGSVGLTNTAGGVLFMSNGGGIEAIQSTDGRPLWHSEIGALSSPPETFLLDGKQHVLASAGTGLYMFVLN